MSQVHLYSDGLPVPLLWGWRYEDTDTGLVFADREAAFADAFAKHPDVPIG